jgi:hypothetical protein
MSEDLSQYLPTWMTRPVEVPAPNDPSPAPAPESPGPAAQTQWLDDAQEGQ